jgi:hypothetical protein
LEREKLKLAVDCLRVALEKYPGRVRSSEVEKMASR